MNRYRAIQLLEHMIDHSIKEMEKMKLEGIAAELKDLKEYVNRKLE